MITPRQLRAELDELLARAKLDPSRFGMEFSEALDREHRRNRRRYAEVDTETGVFYFARATLELPRRHRRGLLAHEVGHVVCHRRLGAAHTEAQADLCALRATGVQVGYDRRWPGKGLQVAKNPGRARSRVIITPWK